jgi:hypothetical protein
MTELEAQVEELQGTLERERSERMARETDLEQRLERAGTALGREHGMRLMAEQRLGDALASLEEAEQGLDRRAAAATSQVGRLEEFQKELGDAREEAASERAEHQRFRQHLDALGQSETDARRARDQQLSDLERARAQAVQTAESAERALRQAREGRARAAHAAPGPELRDAAGADESSSDASATSESGPGQAEGRELPTRGRRPNPPFAHADPTGGRKPRGRRRLLGARLRRRSLAPCAVCRCPRPASTDAEATALGWALRGAGALCPTCQREGWRFPEGATVPFRSVDF